MLKQYLVMYSGIMYKMLKKDLQSNEIKWNIGVKQIPAPIYLFKVNNGSFRKRCEICSKLTIKTSEQRH